MLNVRAQDGDVSTVDGQLLGEVDGQCRLRPGSARAPAGSRLELNGRISRQAGNKARQGTATRTWTTHHHHHHHTLPNGPARGGGGSRGGSGHASSAIATRPPEPAAAWVPWWHGMGPAAATPCRLRHDAVNGLAGLACARGRVQRGGARPGGGGFEREKKRRTTVGRREANDAVAADFRLAPSRR